MKGSYKKIVLFCFVILIIQLLNNLIVNILANYIYMDILIVLLLIAFKIIFGFEKVKPRYEKENILNLVILFLISFIIYYLLGIFTGFYTPGNYLNFYGLRTFVIPAFIYITLKEILRYHMVLKADKSIFLNILITIIFVYFDLIIVNSSSNLDTGYGKFVFIALSILPILSNNIAATYIANKVGVKINIFWLLIINLYTVFVPIVPNFGAYFLSLVRLIFPILIAYNVYSFFKKRSNEVPLSYRKKHKYIEAFVIAIIVFVLAYLVSGYFRFYAVAVATGSMVPKINVGDVVIIDQKYDYKELEKGQVIAFKYEGVLIVHRINNIVTIKDDYYIYTKGDANEDPDNFFLKPEMILGTVNKKIPYIGLPTVWLNNLLK